MSTNTFHLLLDAFAAEWPEGTPPSQRLVLLWLAKFADANTGKTFVSRERLAKDTGLSLRGTKAAVTDLAALGHIAIKPRAHGRFDVITVHPIRGATVAPQGEEGNGAEVQILPSEVQKTTPRGATVAHISSHHRLLVEDDDRDIRAANSRHADITDLVNFYTEKIEGAWRLGSKPGGAFEGVAFPRGTIRQHLEAGVDPSWLVAIVARCLDNGKNKIRSPVTYLGTSIARLEQGIGLLSKEERATFEELEEWRLGKRSAKDVEVGIEADAVEPRSPTSYREDESDDPEVRAAYDVADEFYVKWLTKAMKQRAGALADEGELIEIEAELEAAYSRASGKALNKYGDLSLDTATEWRAAGEWMKQLYEREKKRAS